VRADAAVFGLFKHVTYGGREPGRADRARPSRQPGRGARRDAIRPGRSPVTPPPSWKGGV